MPMSIVTTVAMTAVRYVVCGACRATGVLTEEAAEKAIAVLSDYYADHSQKLPKAINDANERAWKTLEIALAGDSLWHRLTQRGEVVALAQELRKFLDRVDATGLSQDRTACLRELRAAWR